LGEYTTDTLFPFISFSDRIAGEHKTKIIV
jgi:hypothetical protein